METKRIFYLLTVLCGTSLFSTDVWAREQIRIVGSSTVYPFTTVIAEHFGKNSSFKSPIIESTGTGGGFKLFCAGTGEETPDFSDASRRIKKSEFELCQKNGVKELVEIEIGYDGISLAQSKQSPPFSLTKEQIFLALAKEIPGKDGQLIANPHVFWSDISPSLPHEKIEIFGPPPTSGTRDSFVELIMEKGAEKIPALLSLKQKNPTAFEHTWKALREDGAYIEAGENDNLIVQKLAKNPHAVGIFGFSFLEENRNLIQDIPIDGVFATDETINNRTYTAIRPLYLYLKKQHEGVIPGVSEFISEVISDETIGEDGYLASKGLIPLTEEQLKTVQEKVKKRTLVTGEELP